MRAHGRWPPRFDHGPQLCLRLLRSSVFQRCWVSPIANCYLLIARTTAIMAAVEEPPLGRASAVPRCASRPVAARFFCVSKVFGCVLLITNCNLPLAAFFGVRTAIYGRESVPLESRASALVGPQFLCPNSRQVSGHGFSRAEIALPQHCHSERSHYSFAVRKNSGGVEVEASWRRLSRQPKSRAQRGNRRSTPTTFPPRCCLREFRRGSLPLISRGQSLPEIA